MKQGRGQQNFTKRMYWYGKHLLPTTQEMILLMDITQMVNIKIRLIVLFAVKDGEHYTVSKNKTES